MTTIYSVHHPDGTWYYPTKAEAIREARGIIRALEEDGTFADAATVVSVERVRVTDRLRRRDLFCQLLNGESFAEEQEQVPV